MFETILLVGVHLKAATSQKLVNAINLTFKFRVKQAFLLIVWKIRAENFALLN